MRVIRKYTLTMEREQDMELPARAHILKVGEQNGKPVMWALVDHSAPAVRGIVRIFETGEEFQEFSKEHQDGFKGDYLGSFTLSDGREFHVVRAA